MSANSSLSGKSNEATVIEPSPSALADGWGLRSAEHAEADTTLITTPIPINRYFRNRVVTTSFPVGSPRIAQQGARMKAARHDA